MDNPWAMVFATLRGPRRGLVIVSSAYLVNALIGTWLAISNDIPGRPFGIQTGLPVALDFAFGLGSGLSAPLPMLIALAVLANSVARQDGRRSIFWIGVLGCCFLAGMLVEPTLGEAIRGQRQMVVIGVVIANVLLPIVIIGLAIRTARQVDGGLHEARVELPSG